MAIAIPRVSQYITNSRKDSFVSEGTLFIDRVRNDATSEEYPLPISNSDVTIITLDKASLQKSKKKSSFGGKFLYNKSYVAIINVGSGTYPEYQYYLAQQDSKGYAVRLTEESELTPEGVIANARNKMEFTIQSLCGTDTGLNVSYPTILGLEKVQPVGADGNKISWNATIFSSSSCANSD